MNRHVIEIASLLICFSLGCSQSSYRAKYKPTGDEGSQEFVRGAYTKFKSTLSDSVFMGELIFIDDSIYFLTGENQLIVHPINEIVTLNAQFTRFNERSYLALVAVAVPSFLCLLAKSKEVNTIGTVGLIGSGPGLFALLLNSKDPHFISYPDIPVEAFRKYARYPEELPEDFKLRPPKISNDPVAIGTYNMY